MTSISSVTSQPKSITDLQKATCALSTALSFLTEKEKNDAEHVCKQWQKYSKPIENGYGDFILLHDNGTAPEDSTYRKIFPLLNTMLPQVRQTSLPHSLQITNDYIKKNFPDSHVKAVFIPRALYELCFLLYGCEEELELAKKQERCKNDKCYHIEDCGGLDPTENLGETAIYLATRLNRFIVGALNISPQGMTEEACQEAGKDILKRFTHFKKEIKEKSIELKFHRYPILEKICKGKMIPPAHLQKAISLECSKEAENAIILYRGSSFAKEPLWRSSNPYCPSFGISLFAGYPRDPGACAGLRMFNDPSTIAVYAVLVPLEDHWKDAFDIPRVNTICGLDAQGEYFHARAKCLKPERNYIEGFCDTLNSEIQDRLVSPLSLLELQSILDRYFSKRIEFFNRSTPKKEETAS